MKPIPTTDQIVNTVRKAIEPLRMKRARLALEIEQIDRTIASVKASTLQVLVTPSFGQKAAPTTRPARVISKATRAKMAAAAKRRWAREREAHG